METRKIVGRFVHPNGQPMTREFFRFRINHVSPTLDAIVGSPSVGGYTDENGDFETELWVNAEGTVPTIWECYPPRSQSHFCFFLRPTDNTTVELSSLSVLTETGLGHPCLNALAPSYKGIGDTSPDGGNANQVFYKTGNIGGGALTIELDITPQHPHQIRLYVNALLQHPDKDFEVVGTTLTYKDLSSLPNDGSQVPYEIYYD